MMTHTIAQLTESIGETVALAGWVYKIRSSGGIVFLQVRDGSGTVQVIAARDALADELFAQCQALTLESSVRITGTVRADERAPSGVEVDLTGLEVVHLVSEEYPITKSDHGPDFLLEHRHLWLREPRQWAIQRVRHQLIMGIYEFFTQEGFIKIDAPIFTPSACEGTTTLFPVEYVNEKTVYLSQSGQLYLEAAIASFGKVFDFGPTFRAEKSKTRRHLTEFWMMDAEAAFMEHEENMALQERLIVHLVQRVLAHSSDELALLGRDRSALEKITASFVRMTYTEAVAQLQDLGSSITFGMDFGNDDETILTKEYDKPIMVEKYPAEVKAFYMKRDPENPELVLCNDVLAPEGYGEIFGGSQREDDYDTLRARIIEEELPLDDFEWYLDLRKYGSTPHSGFGLGLERMVAWICGLAHVREAIPFPRTIYRVYP